MKTKTKLLVDFCKSGLTTYTIYGLVCAHNEGTCSYTMKEIRAIIKGKIVDSSANLKDMKLLLNDEQGILEVYEDGENLTYSVQENEIFELAEMNDESLLLNPVFQLNK